MDFDFFPTVDVTSSPEHQAVLDFEQQVGAMSQTMPLVPEMVRDPEVLRIANHQFQYVSPVRGWYIFSNLDEAAAHQFGARAFRSLVGRRNLPAQYVALHEVPLWVGTSDGRAIKIEPRRS